MNASPDRVNSVGLGVAVSLAVATAVAQLIDYQFFDLRLRALDSNTHRSIFGAVSLLANMVAVALAISLAVRARNRETVILSGALTAMLALRVTYPSHVLLVSLPLAGIALVILWRLGQPSAGEGLWTIRVGCSLLVISFAIHASELEAPHFLPSHMFGGNRGGGAIISGSHAEAIGNARLPTSTWTDLALTYEGSTLRFYVNGRPVSTTAKTGNITTSTNPLTIGSDPFHGQEAGSGTAAQDASRSGNSGTAAQEVRALTKHEAELVGWIMIAAGLLNLRTSTPRRRSRHPRWAFRR
jgi:hypothetical protein